MENIEITNTLEAILFAIGREISYTELSNVLKIEEEKIQEEIQKLKERYNKNYGVTLVEVSNMVQLVTNNKYYDVLNNFVENSKRKNLSNTVLETLSIIAYNPKITKAEIESIRGVNSDFAVSRLLEIGLIEEVERLNLPGRPAAYSVTTEFLKACDIKEISELPNFDDIVISDEENLEKLEEKLEEKVEERAEQKEKKEGIEE